MSWLQVGGRPGVSTQFSELVAPQQASRSDYIVILTTTLVALSALAWLAIVTEPLWLCIILPAITLNASAVYAFVFPPQPQPWYSGWFTSQSSGSSGSSSFTDFYDTYDSGSSSSAYTRSSSSDDIVRNPIAVSSDHSHVIPGVG